LINCSLWYLIDLDGLTPCDRLIQLPVISRYFLFAQDPLYLSTPGFVFVWLLPALTQFEFQDAGAAMY